MKKKKGVPHIFPRPLRKGKKTSMTPSASSKKTEGERKKVHALNNREELNEEANMGNGGEASCN